MASAPRIRVRRSATSPVNPPITKNRGITCSAQLTGSSQVPVSPALANTGPSGVTVTPTMSAWSMTTPVMQSARTRSIALSRGAVGTGIRRLLGSFPGG